MKKIIRIIGNVLFLVNTVILSIFFYQLVKMTSGGLYFENIFSLNFISIPIIVVCYIVVLIIFVLNIIQLRKSNLIIQNSNYNVLFLLVNLTVLFIFLRDIFDSMIPLGSSLANDISTYNYYLIGGMFINYNMPLITVLYIGILAYNLLNKSKIKKSS